MPIAKHTIKAKSRFKTYKHPMTHRLDLVIPLSSPTTVSKITAFRNFLINNGQQAKVFPDNFPPLSSMLAFRLDNINIGDAPSQRYANYDQLAADSDDLKFSFKEIMRLLQGLKDPINKLIKEAGLTDVLDVKLGKLQPHIFRSTPMPAHVPEIHPIPSKSTDTLEKISPKFIVPCMVLFLHCTVDLVYNRFAAAGCLTSATSRPRDVLTFLNTARRTYRNENGYTDKREEIDLKYLYSLDGITQFLSPGSTFPKNILRPARFDFGTAQVMGIRLQRVFPEGWQSDPVYDGELKFSKENDYDIW